MSKENPYYTYHEANRLKKILLHKLFKNFLLNWPLGQGRYPWICCCCCLPPRRLGKKHFFVSSETLEIQIRTNLKLRQNSVNQILNQHALFFFLLTGAT